MLEFFKNLPWWIAWPGRGLLAVCGGYVSNHPEIYPSWAVLVGALTALWVVLAFLWHGLNSWREHNKKPRLRLDPNAIIMICLAGALSASIWQWWRIPTSLASSPNKSFAKHAELFLKDPVLGIWLDPKTPLVFLGTPTQTTERLRLLVEYSLYRGGWMLPVRFEVDPIKEPIKGQRVKVPVARIGTKQNGGMEDLWWGTDSGSDNLVANNPAYAGGAATLTRGRIVVIGTDNKEQNALYFQIVRAPNDEKGNPRFTVLQGRDVTDWISDWEKNN